MAVPIAVQVTIIGIRTVVDRRPVGSIAKAKQRLWPIVPAMAVVPMVSPHVSVMLLGMVAAIVVVTISVMRPVILVTLMVVIATVLRFVTGECR
jgi:hypothetical protein